MEVQCEKRRCRERQDSTQRDKKVEEMIMRCRENQGNSESDSHVRRETDRCRETLAGTGEKIQGGSWGDGEVNVDMESKERQGCVGRNSELQGCTGRRRDKCGGIQ